jgi:hypothetical protein
MVNGESRFSTTAIKQMMMSMTYRLHYLLMVEINAIERPHRSLAHVVSDLVFGLPFIFLIGTIRADSPIIG